ncbi:hypothetical protein R5H30_05320 [Sulfitobacter sp. D35]|uniref:hypothetical protein n=1 Tax=Sulfitobacter sp. D35 TaxID=3083252 RepID=UPI00296FC2C8|nr:hypothetical protein [Sulfitobacter sp. D35]MDW4497394.1 hypothetical protein [Sulfitobacter sp. D35]
MTRFAAIALMLTALAACTPPDSGYQSSDDRLQSVGEDAVADIDATGFDAL